MMELSLMLALLALACMAGSIYTGVGMVRELRSRGIPANPLFMRWMIYKYMNDYRRVTLEESGEVGSLYRLCATTSGLAALFGFGAILAQIM